MKAPQGLIELVLVVSIMMAGVPLLTSLVRVCSLTEMRYIEDKTMYNAVDSIEYELIQNGNQVYYQPKMLAPINIDYGGALAIAIVNDDYCPDTSKKIWYAYDEDITTRTLLPTTYGYLNIVNGWASNYRNEWNLMLTGSSGRQGSLLPQGDQRQLAQMYLAWNGTMDSWMITTKPINIFR